MEAMSHRWI